MSDTTLPPRVAPERLEEIRTTLLANLDQAAFWPTLDDDQAEAFGQVASDFLHDHQLGMPGWYCDRSLMAQTLLTGAAIGLLPAKPASMWVALLTRRALNWIEREPPTAQVDAVRETDTALGSQAA